MNLYLRYFNSETLVYSVDEAIAFLNDIPEISLTKEMEEDIREYAASDLLFPKRYKVRPRVYFIIIKTTAATMLDFKEKKAVRSNNAVEDRHEQASNALGRLSMMQDGWYEGMLDFKRVVTIPTTGKCEYRDTRFVVRCKACSGQDCYDRMVDYLRERVDHRSQFPSSKGKNFRFKYLGMWK